MPSWGLVYSLRKLSPKKLLIFAGFLIAVGITWNYFDYRHAASMMADVEKIEVLESQKSPIPDELKGSQKEWEYYLEKRTPKAIWEFTESHNKGYFEVLLLLAPINMEFESYMFYRYNTWDILSMMLIGIALFKLKVLSAARKAKIYWAMVVTGYSIGLAVNYLELKNILDQNFSQLSFAESNVT